MPTSRFLFAYVLVNVFAIGGCHEERDWTKCNETVTECRPGFVCDIAAARCVPTVAADGGGVPNPDAPITDGPVRDAPVSDATSRPPPDAPPVRCSGNASCPTATPVCGPDGVCVACLAATDCKDPGRAFCVDNRCVGCGMAGAGACTGTTPACEATSGRCVQCTDAAMHCSSDPGKAFCVANMCAGCAAAGAGACKGATPACEATSGRCVQCTDGSHCTADPTKAFCVANVCAGCQAAGAGACKDPTPACATSGRCVECVSSADCQAPGKPICDTAMNKCVPCATDAQCAAKGGGPGVCMFHDGGRCASDAETIYVQRSGTCAMTMSATGGTSAMPYCLAQTGVDALTPTRRVIVLRGPDPLTSMSIPSSSPAITVIGQMSASLEPGATGPGIKLSGADVYVRGVSIKRGSFEGVVADSGAVLRMNRCLVEGNAKGGILINGAGFDIMNTVVAGNGPGEAAGSVFWGGVAVFSPAAGKPNRIVNATIVNNNAPGVVCSTALQTATGLIASGNTLGQTGTACAVPMCCTGDPLLTPAYRLMGGSPCIDKVPANMSAPDDIDGEARPKGVASDCGADEF